MTTRGFCETIRHNITCRKGGDVVNLLTQHKNNFQKAFSITKTPELRLNYFEYCAVVYDEKKDG